jgi:ubiquinone/menaquinone biosynthesis C-methylase UbiE
VKGARERVWALGYQLGPGRMYQPAYKRVVEHLAPAQGNLLDVGCGPGWLCVHAARGRPELDCVGIDTSPRMLDQARRNARGLLNCTFRQMDAASIQYPAATFDVIVGVQTMHHWTQPERILAELQRVLKPGCSTWLLDVDPKVRIPPGWLDRPGGWPPEALLRRNWKRWSLGDAGFQRMLQAAQRLDWSVRVEHVGLYRSLVCSR